MRTSNVIRLIVGIILVTTIWLLPTGIAVLRNSPRVVSVLLWNTFGLLLLGIGWLIALVIALSGEGNAAAVTTPSVIVHNVINSPGTRTGDSASPHSDFDLISQLGTLRERGLLTAEEFSAKKLEILSRKAT